MKKRLLGDVLIYFIAPIILFAFFKEKVKFYSTIISFILFISYSILIKYTQCRFNLSGILFASIYTVIQSLKISLTDPYHIYIYDSYCLLLLSIFIITLNLFNKNIFKQLYIDVLKLLNLSQVQIMNTIKRNNLYKDFYKITNIANLHILILVLIRLYSIIILGKNEYLKNLNLEIVICTLFFIIEAVLVTYFKRKINDILQNGKIKNIKFMSSEPRVINFDKYKNLNK